MDISGIITGEEYVTLSMLTTEDGQHIKLSIDIVDQKINVSHCALVRSHSKGHPNALCVSEMAALCSELVYLKGNQDRTFAHRVLRKEDVTKYIVNMVSLLASYFPYVKIGGFFETAADKIDLIVRDIQSSDKGSPLEITFIDPVGCSISRRSDHPQYKGKTAYIHIAESGEIVNMKPSFREALKSDTDWQPRYSTIEPTLQG